jgi:hypothetical protein
VAINILANSSTNTYISQSANYIVSNQIFSSASFYVKSLNWKITTRVVTPYGASWTIVAVDYSGATVTQTSSSSTTTMESVVQTTAAITSAQTQSIIGLGAAIIAFVIVTLVVVVYLATKAPSVPLAAQRTGNDQL